MIIGGLQKVSLIDYPGKVSAIVFTRGCNLRCRYCQNPELVLPERYCAPISEEYVLEFLASRKDRIEGVVITGGEPTIQNGLFTFMKRVKEMGYLIKLDTAGVSPRLLELAIGEGIVDYIAMDLKAPFDKYADVTGVRVDTEKIRQSISIIRNGGLDYEFRTTVARSMTSIEDIISIAKSISGSKKYILQRFVKSETLDNTLVDGDTYTDNEFNKIIVQVRRYVGDCSLR